MPVCYEFNATANVLGYSKSSEANGTTTAEGYQNEGKFLRVEDADSGNIQWFAGVVATNECAGKTGPRWLDIYIPNGAIVPVRSVVVNTVGRTVLSVITATQSLGQPLSGTQARPVAIAEESAANLTIVGTITGTFTVGESVSQATSAATGIVTAANTGATTFYVRVRSGTFSSTYTITGATSGATCASPSSYTATACLCLAKLDPSLFIYQDNTGDALIAAASGTSALVVNRINVTSAQTDGRFTAFEIISAATGNFDSSGYAHTLYCQTDISAAITASQNAGVSFWTNITGGTHTFNQYYGLEIGIYEDGANLSSVGTTLAPLSLKVQLDGTNGCAANKVWMIDLNALGAAEYPDGLITCYNAGSMNMIAKTSAAVTHIIPIQMRGDMSGGPSAGIYYIMVSSAA